MVNRQAEFIRDWGGGGNKASLILKRKRDFTN